MPARQKEQCVFPDGKTETYIRIGQTRVVRHRRLGGDTEFDRITGECQPRKFTDRMRITEQRTGDNVDQSLSGICTGCERRYECYTDNG